MVMGAASKREVYVCFILYLFEVVSAQLIVSTSTGYVEGVPSQVKDVDAFLGIPFAEPPLGELRFARPVPKKKWFGVYNASSLPPACIQIADYHPYYFMPNVTNMSEDCLYLNMWVPKSDSDEGLRPVIIFFHPGAYITGSSNQKTYDGSHFASRGGVVVVTVNYRLGAMGYFLSYTEEAGGNMAMYDQMTAVKWVKENAKEFNADPENIVLMGCSAGAYSISLLMVSPLSKKLFKRAIIESGSSLHPVFMRNDRLFESSQKLAALVGCSNETSTLKSDPHSVVRCLKTKPKEDFVKAEQILLAASPIVFYPRNHDAFLPKRIVDFLHEGQVRKDFELLCGITEEEGSMMMVTGLNAYMGYYGNKLAHKMNKYRAIALGRGATIVSGQPNISGMVDVYLRNLKDRTPIGYTKMVANIIGDFSIACNTVFLADFLSVMGNPVYFYKLGFRSASTPMADWVGASHLDELQYVFGNPYHKNFTSEEIELSHLLMDRWSAFAKTGNPNVPDHISWLPYSYKSPFYLNFGQEEESIRLRPNERCEYWRKLFESDIDPEMIRFLKNSGTDTSEASSIKKSVFFILFLTCASLFCNFLFCFLCLNNKTVK